MSGDDRARFCFSCSKSVYDLTAMSEDEAEAFLAVHVDDEDAGVRLFRRPDGRILVSECQRGASKRHGRRVALAASLTACALLALGAALGDVRWARAHPLPQGSSRFEVPRAPVVEAPPRDYEIEPPRPEERYEPWGREDLGRGQGFATSGEEAVVVFEEPQSGVFWVGVADAVEVSGELPSEVVLRIVRFNLQPQRRCYEDALRDDQHLAGRVPVRFTVGEDGRATGAESAEDAGSTVSKTNLTRCVVQATGSLVFPRPGHGNVKVTVTFTFRPDR